MKPIVLATAAALLSAPAFAQDLTGDAAAGEEQFARQCASCHVVKDENDEVLAGRSAITGPNLYGLDGRLIGSIEDFRYSEGLLALNEEGRVWTEADFVPYAMDTTAWLREATGDRRVRSLMSWRVRDEQQAHDIYAFIASLGGGAAEADMTEAEASE